MFISKKDLKKVIEETLGIGDSQEMTIKSLERDIKNLTREKAEIEFKKTLEEKELTHLVKMKEEKILIETQKKEIDLSKKFQEKEMELQKEYFEKVMGAVKDGQKKMEDIYTKILDRLPNVNMNISKKG